MSCTRTRMELTLSYVIIVSVSHWGLRRPVEEGDPRLLQSTMVDRLGKIVNALLLSDNMNSLIQDSPNGWHIHRLSGNRGNGWSISVSGNWRMTFELDGNQILRLNLEDYH